LIVDVIGEYEHAAWQVAALSKVFVVHDKPSSHAAGHAPAPLAIAVSHVSPVSTAPLPHGDEQSLSFVGVAPAGQQPSPLIRAVICACVHAAVQLDPVIASAVHASTSLQLVGHAPAPLAIAVSHVSPVSTAPLPHGDEQSLSVLAVAPVGQHPSPLIAIVIGELEQAA
jgi:hypothetical protein